MTPEQREKKNAGDRARRAAMKAGIWPTAAMPKARQVAKAQAVAASPVAVVKALPLPTPSTPAPKTHGGARAGSGKKPTGKPPLVVTSFKGTQQHIDKFKKAGGGEWIRGVLDTLP